MPSLVNGKIAFRMQGQGRRGAEEPSVRCLLPTVFSLRENFLCVPVCGCMCVCTQYVCVCVCMETGSVKQTQEELGWLSPGRGSCLPSGPLLLHGPGRQSETLWSCPVSSFHGWRSWPPIGKFGSSAHWGRAVWAVRCPACPGGSWGVFKILFGEKESPDMRTLPKDQAKPSGKSCLFVSGEQGAPFPPHGRHGPTAEEVGWCGMAIRSSEVEPTWQR